MSAIGKFLRRPLADKRLILEALFFLFWSKLLIHGIPFRWLAPHLGQHMVESPRTLTLEERAVAIRVEWAVYAASEYAPMKFVCFPQAVTAKWMLRRRHLASTLYLGVALKKDDKMIAHAWLRAGDKILTGREQSFHHKMVALFGEGGPTAAKA